LIGAGIHPKNWLPIEADDTANRRGKRIERFDWLGRPGLAALPRWARGPAALAAVASRQDNARRFDYEYTAAPPYLLKAWVEVSRPPGRMAPLRFWELAREFFEDCLAEIADGALDPLRKPLLSRNGKYDAARLYLAEQAEKYSRDIARARRTKAFVPVASDLKAYQSAVLQEPLLLGEGGAARENQRQLNCTSVQPHTHRVVDAAWTARPESQFFKDFARADTKNAAGGHGFEMLVVVNELDQYVVPNAVNNAEYIISLDPERAAGAHLYELWARLQVLELAALERPENADVERTFQGGGARAGFEARAKGISSDLMRDPWFDGAPFDFTLVQTPGKAGTRIGAPCFDRLEEDPILVEVRKLYEDSVFLSASVEDIAAQRGATSVPPRAFDFHGEPSREDACADGCYRFGRVLLHRDADLLGPGLGRQIGPSLYHWLHPEQPAGEPSDFHDRHLVVERDLVAVWSRKGLMVAYQDRPDATARVERMRQWLGDLAKCAIDVRKHLQDRTWTDDRERLAVVLDEMEREVLPQMVRLQWDTNELDGAPLRRFFEASGFSAAAHSLHTLVDALSDRQSRASGLALQCSAEWVEIFIMAVYLTELAHKFVPELHSVNHWASNALLAVASLGTILMGIWCLKPYKDHHVGKGRAAMLRRYGPLGAWILLVLGVSIWAGELRPMEQGSPRSTVVDVQSSRAGNPAKPQ
ncbi:MAG: hypothetical protein NTW28_24535, partial [Candidatus Solibacter sp.]|nr:hypothetical protein [Candidatus Solibacter sp.]